MRILPLSDLHFEFLNPEQRKAFVRRAPDADVVLLAGDVGVCQGGTLQTALELFCAKYAHVVFIPGNHEYYGSAPHDVDLARRALTSRLKNLHWLENETAEIAGQRFVGTTLWFADPKSSQHKNRVNDFSAVKGFEPWVYRQNEKAVQFLTDTVSSGDVVLTHHLPDERAVHPRYRFDELNRFFLCQLPRELLGRAKLWQFGHTHEASEFLIGTCHFLCNPKGYPDERYNRFRSDRVLEL